MRTVFVLFSTYKDAEDTVNELRAHGFKESDINVVIQKATAKNYMEVNFSTLGVDVTDEIGEVRVHGLDRLIGERRPLPTIDAGEIYAAGDMATTVARTAATQEGGRGLAQALIDLDVPEDVSKTYTEGIATSGVLLWVRASDDRAPEAAHIMNTHKGKHVGSYIKPVSH